MQGFLGLCSTCKQRNIDVRLERISACNEQVMATPTCWVENEGPGWLCEPLPLWYPNSGRYRDATDVATSCFPFI